MDMQFKVPTNVQREDQIVGPLTLKQLIIVGIGGSIAYGIYVSLANYFLWITWLPPVAIVTILTLAFAFIKPLNLSFAKWLLLWFESALMPKQRFWVQSSADPIPTFAPQVKPTEKAKKKAEVKAMTIEEKQRKLEEITKQLEKNAR